MTSVFKKITEKWCNQSLRWKLGMKISLKVQCIINYYCSFVAILLTIYCNNRSKVLQKKKNHYNQISLKYSNTTQLFSSIQSTNNIRSSLLFNFIIPITISQYNSKLLILIISVSEYRQSSFLFSFIISKNLFLF